MPEKRAAKRNRNNVQDLPVPNAAKLLELLDFRKLLNVGEKVLAREYYPLLEEAMNELAEEKTKMKGLVAEYIGENQVSWILLWGLIKRHLLLKNDLFFNKGGSIFKKK